MSKNLSLPQTTLFFMVQPSRSCLVQLLGDETSSPGIRPGEVWMKLWSWSMHLSVGLYNTKQTNHHTFQRGIPSLHQLNLCFSLGRKVEGWVWTCLIKRNILGGMTYLEIFGHEGSWFLFMYLFSAEVEPWFTSQNLHSWFSISLTGIHIYYCNIFQLWKVGGEHT